MKSITKLHLASLLIVIFTACDGSTQSEAWSLHETEELAAEDQFPRESVDQEDQLVFLPPERIRFEGVTQVSDTKIVITQYGIHLTIVLPHRIEEKERNGRTIRVGQPPEWIRAGENQEFLTIAFATSNDSAPRTFDISFGSDFGQPVYARGWGRNTVLSATDVAREYNPRKVFVWIAHPADPQALPAWAREPTAYETIQLKYEAWPPGAVRERTEPSHRVETYCTPLDAEEPVFNFERGVAGIECRMEI